jgi:hypothetical protein
MKEKQDQNKLRDKKDMKISTYIKYDFEKVKPRCISVSAPGFCSFNGINNILREN